MAPSQSSTELKVLKSGMDLSNSGCEGLERGVGVGVGRGGGGVGWRVRRRRRSRGEGEDLMQC